MRHLYPEHLTAEATSSIGSCCALSQSAVVLELVSLDIGKWLHSESLLPVEHLQKLFGNEEAKKNLEETVCDEDEIKSSQTS